MEETLNRSTLSQKDKELLEKVLVKSPSEMTESEKAIICARRSYLMAIEKETFKEILEEKKTDKPKNEKKTEKK